MKEITGPVTVAPGEVLECNFKSGTCNMHVEENGGRRVLGEKGKFSGISSVAVEGLAMVTTGTKKSMSRSGVTSERTLTTVKPQRYPITCSKRGTELQCSTEW